jgi:hypothetical protein
MQTKICEPARCIFTVLTLGALMLSAHFGQQTASTVEPPRTVDRSFRYDIEEPAYPQGNGPVILIDEAHNNFHTGVGTYRPFAELLRWTDM